MIEVRNVFKNYSGKTVVKGVSLTIPKGRLTAFIGANGAGKSTLLSIMSRLIPADKGDIVIDGREIRQWRTAELARKISILKQSNHIHVRLTVRELVSFGRYPYSQGRLTPGDKLKINEAIRYLELEELEDRYIDQLSGGQCQRAFIAMVVAQDTEYILMDEPLNNLDMKHSVQIMQVLRRLVDELGKSVIIVIHDINFASCYSDRIVALKDGAIVKEGAVESIIRPEALRDIYDMNIPVEIISGNRIGVYFA